MDGPRKVTGGENGTGLFSIQLLERSWFTEETFEIRTTRPERFAFVPGQFIRFFHDGMERDYSIVSAPDDPFLGFCVRLKQQGRMSTCLAQSHLGTCIRVSAAMGYFTFRAAERPAVFVATGTGIAPFVSMARSGVSGFTLLHGAPSRKDLYYRREMEAAARSYMPCLSRSVSDDAIFGGRVTGYLEKHLHVGRYDFYLCGRREMIGDCLAVLDGRFPDSRAFTEIFD